MGRGSFNCLLVGAGCFVVSAGWLSLLGVGVPSGVSGGAGVLLWFLCVGLFLVFACEFGERFLAVFWLFFSNVCGGGWFWSVLFFAFRCFLGFAFGVYELSGVFVLVLWVFVLWFGFGGFLVGICGLCLWVFLGLLGGYSRVFVGGFCCFCCCLGGRVLRWGLIRLFFVIVLYCLHAFRLVLFCFFAFRCGG